jgi:uncharacterized protein (TIGR02145 family)
MKKITLLFDKHLVSCALCLVSIFAHSQNYKITFTGTGASSKVDSVQVENLTQCKSISLSGSDTLVLYGNVGIKEISNSADNGLRIYPNPMTGYCFIDFEATAQCETTIELYDIAGKRITQVQEFLFKGNHIYSLRGLGSGIYVLKVESAQYTYSAKIISVNSTSGIPQIKHIEAKDMPYLPDMAYLKSLKPYKSLINMQYTKWDTLKLTGFSGIYSTVNILVPTKNQTDTFNFIACTDGDGNNYPIVQIGKQIWMEKNLKTTKYNDGTAIPNVTDGLAWSGLIIGAYCWYNDSIKYKSIYGGLYNWFAADSSKLCPSGWHVPDSLEWNTLLNYLGGASIAGRKMKDTCSTYWLSPEPPFLPNAGATNSSGFTALPGGFRIYGQGTFNSLGRNGYWWSATEGNASFAAFCGLFYYASNAALGCFYKQYGYSVRCVKD